jgi:uncharacterized protein (TIGR03437 family)
MANRGRFLLATSILSLNLFLILSIEQAAAQSTGSVTTVSAANFTAPVAPDSIAAAFRVNLATRTEIAAGLPLPTELAGTTVVIKDQAGIERMAPLFFVSSGQVNLTIPAGTGTGTATVTIRSGGGVVSTGTVEVRASAPGLFSARSDGRGIAAAQMLRVKTDGAQITEDVFQFSDQGAIAKPVCLGLAGERLFLILFLTGIRAYRMAEPSASSSITKRSSLVMLDRRAHLSGSIRSTSS